MNVKEIDENKVSGIKWWLGPLGVKARVFILEKVVQLSGLGVLSPVIQQGLLGTGHVWPPDWWSAWSYCLGLVLWDVVTSLTPTAYLWRIQHVLVIRVLSPQAVTVQDMVCQLYSYDERGRHVHSVQWVVELLGLIHDLVN